MAKILRLSLRDVRRLEQEIEKLVARVKDEIKPVETISIFRYQLEHQSVKRLQERLVDQVEEAFTLTDFRYYLRGLVKTANQAEVDNLTLELARNETSLELISSVMTTSEENYRRYGGTPKVKRIAVVELINIPEVNAQLASMQEAVKNGQAATTYELNLMTKEIADKFDKAANSLRREISKLKDALAVANGKVSIEVTVSDEVENLLEKYALNID